MGAKVVKIKCSKLLSELRTVMTGLDSEATIQQSNCFVFKKGKVMTYNDDAACRVNCCLPITAAIDANTMLRVLEKWPEEEIEFKREKGKLLYKGKNIRGGFNTEDRIILPTKNIEKPKTWNKLPNDFLDAVTQVMDCASTDPNSPHLSCIHITPKLIEACDGVQAARYHTKTLFKEEVLLQHMAMKRIVGLEVNEFSTTKLANWVHFRNAAGLVVSCHKCFEDYPTDILTKIFNKKGTPTTLPKGLNKIVERLKAHMDQDKGSQWVTVALESGVAKISSTGKRGFQTERGKVSYKGKPINFLINPQLLQRLSNKHDECLVTDSSLIIKKDKFNYISSLWVPETKNEK